MFSWGCRQHVMKLPCVRCTSWAQDTAQHPLELHPYWTIPHYLHPASAFSANAGSRPGEVRSPTAPNATLSWNKNSLPLDFLPGHMSKRTCGPPSTVTGVVSARVPPGWASASRADLPERWWLWWMPRTHSPPTRYLTPTAGYSSAGCRTGANPVSRADMEHRSPLRE